MPFVLSCDESVRNHDMIAPVLSPEKPVMPSSVVAVAAACSLDVLAAISLSELVVALVAVLVAELVVLLVVPLPVVSLEIAADVEPCSLDAGSSEDVEPPSPHPVALTLVKRHTSKAVRLLRQD